MKKLKYFDGKDIQSISINTEDHELLNINPDGSISIYLNGENIRTIKTPYYEIESIYGSKK